MINPLFAKAFNEEAFTEFIQGLIPSLSLSKKRIETRTGFKSIQQIAEAIEGNLDLVVFIAKPDSSLKARVEIIKSAYAVLKSHARSNALVAYIVDDSSEWRLSLITTQVTRTKEGVKETISNPRRFSYVLGPSAKINTPYQFLIKQGAIKDFTELQKRFSLEVVNEEFYKEISENFIKLVGGTFGFGKSKKIYEPALKLPSVPTKSQISVEFAVRLIGRIIFCWFLREKKSQVGTALIPKELLSLEAVNRYSDFYHQILESIFFEVLNKPIKSRGEPFSNKLYSLIPYLNGGLFSPNEDDYYKRRINEESKYHDTLIIPDEWLKGFFQTLETYNFTIDENTSFDEELSIDPEMLGRIFENLLAEINPETGESARKSTGSYYTPRAIVDFMVDESLLLYLNQKTNIKEDKLRSIISYDLVDDSVFLLSSEEKQNIIDAIGELKLLDPACGSGAFPMGALQKIVFILQQIDSDGEVWFKKQLEKVSLEFKKDIQRRFTNHEFNFLRKLGIVRECIFGVDIQPIAIEISRLRCFLTLIVDEQINDQEEGRGVKPLPNLDFKFIVANSLISPPEDDRQAQDSFILDDFQSDLEMAVSEYFSTDDLDMKSRAINKLHEIIDGKVEEKVNAVLKDTGLHMGENFQKVYREGKRKSHEILLKEAEMWKSYKNIFKNKKVDFFDPKYFFPSVKGGFDIIIANPPYLRERGNKQIFKEVNESEFGKKYHQGKMDFWFYFLHRAIDLVKDQGAISYITSRYWLNSLGAKKLIERVSKELSFTGFVDIGKLKVFNSVAGQHMVAVYKKAKDVDSFIYKKLENDISDIANNHNTQNLKIKLLSNKLVFSDNEIILEAGHKINDGILLGNICDISVGVQESPDKISNKQISKIKSDIVKAGDGVFVLSQDEFNNLKSNATEKSVIKKYLDPNDVYRYGITWHDKYMIYADKETKEKIASDNDFSHIKQHLDKFKEFITSSNKPYGLHRPRDIKYFISPKIVFKGMFVENQFAYDESGYFTGFSFSLVTTKDPGYNLKYILAILNSKFALDWFYKNGKQRGAGVDIGVEKLRLFPIKKAAKIDQEPFIEIIDKILAITKSSNYLENYEKQARVKEYEKQIDQLVYKLYGLTSEEIKIIEGVSK